ncbi:PAS domain-containing protein [Kineosporia sp. NBRC 101731]|uniref:PAS domain-containing protein n=1 Tax=Kineosporia sp. NBRC 101731 TaxID=3032199 RepID=UPI0024A10229|nr:PAS domain-containing protein [Kineosporia sp. NBRC 101731]GLY33000.1 phosphonate transporter [Kineosporia sp. NBRC 101731]
MSDQFIDTMWATATKAAAQGGAFASPGELSALTTMSASQADTLPYGAVRVDDKGAISVYNRYESELGGIAPANAIGKNFFTDIAPCTNNKVFRGCFLKAVEQGSADCLFNYTFTYKMRPTEVKVHMHRANGVNWMLIAKK